MCRDHIHLCKSCNHDYECILPNWLCPTLNFDTDARLCDDCKKRVIEEIEREVNDDCERIDRRIK